jgi:hypothetical protein
MPHQAPDVLLVHAEHHVQGLGGGLLQPRHHQAQPRSLCPRVTRGHRVARLRQVRATQWVLCAWHTAQT